MQPSDSIIEITSHSFHAFLHSFIASFILSLFSSFFASFLHVPSSPFIPSFLHSFIHSFLHSLIRSFVRSFMVNAVISTKVAVISNFLYISIGPSFPIETSFFTGGDLASEHRKVSSHSPTRVNRPHFAHGILPDAAEPRENLG